MIPILFPAGTTTFNNNGYGRLNDIISATATEELNGMYELEIEYPLTGVHYADIKEGTILYCTHDDTQLPQPMDIYRRSAPMNGVVTFNARHVAYRLRNVIVRPFTASSLTEVLAKFSIENMTANPFTFWTDFDADGDFVLDHPASIWELMGDSEGSILNLFGGEWEFDGWTIKLHAHRGTDSGVTIRYGTNLISIDHTVDGSEVFNAIVPYWSGKEETVTGDIVGTSDAPLKMYDWTTDSNVEITDEDGENIEFALAEFTVVPKDFTSEFKDKPTIEELDAKAAEWLEQNTPWIPKENIRVDFIALWQTTEYQDYAALQRVMLADTVSVHYPELGVDANAKVIRTTYNVLLDRYDQIEIGKATASFGQVILAESAQYTKHETQSSLVEERDYMTQLIRGGFGGNVVTVTDADGRPTEMLFMDTDDVNTAVNVLRINKNGIGFSSNGVEGPFHSAWTLDGRFNCDFLSTGVVNANLIKTGTLDGQYFNCVNLNVRSYVDSDNYIQMNSGELSLYANGSDTINITHMYDDGEITGGEIQINDSQGTQRILIAADNVNNQTALYLYRENGKYGLALQDNGFFLYNVNGEMVMRTGTRTVSGSSFLELYKDASNITLYENGADSPVHSVLKHFALSFFDPSRSSRSDNMVTLVSSDFGFFTELDLVVMGNKNRLVKGRLLYAHESTEPYFSDIGEGTIGDNGKCVVKIDPVFKQTVDLTGYQVFCTKYGEGDLWVERQKTQFTVHGTPGLSFGWELKAHQYDHNGKRLEEYKVNENYGNS